MALALMCREYMPKNGTTLHALVIDHGLRSSSNEEANRVQQILIQRLSMSLVTFEKQLYPPSN
jgi:tRNA(Ile)-lysidine synthase TilS/MesJ